MIGLAAEVRESAPRRSLGDVVWYILAALPLQSFLDKLAEDVASDVYGRLKTLTARLLRGRSRSAEPEPRLLVLQDIHTGVQVVFEPDLPHEGYEQFLHLDLSTIKRGPLRYDRRMSRWCAAPDDLDEGALQSPSRTD